MSDLFTFFVIAALLIAGGFVAYVELTGKTAEYADKFKAWRDSVAESIRNPFR